MWAIRRRIVTILIVFTALFLLIGVPYMITHREVPSCTDKKRNQGEQDVDCGGPCALMCKESVKSLKVLWVKVFLVRDGMYDLVSYVENDNEAGAPRIPFVARLYDKDGAVIAQQEGTTFAQPNERFAIFSGNMVTGDKIPVSGTIDIDPSFAWLRVENPENPFSVSDEKLIGADRKPKLSAILHNTKPKQYFNIDVTAIIIDKTNQPVGVGRTIVEKLRPNGAEDIFFTWSHPFNYVAATGTCETPVDVVLALDRSGSMSSDGKDPPEPLTAAKQAAVNFVNRLSSERDHAGYISFATEASDPVDQMLTDEMGRLKRVIERTFIHEDGVQFTNIGDAIHSAINEFASQRKNPDARPVIVFLTDGAPTMPKDPNNKNYPTEYARAAAEEAKKRDISIYTIGLGSDVNTTLLKDIATAPDYYYQAASGAELESIYQQIATAMCKKGPSVIEIIPRVNNVVPLSQTR